MVCWYLIVALHSIDKCLISHNLCVSIEEGLETILGLLELLLGYLWRQRQTEDTSAWKECVKKANICLNNNNMHTIYTINEL